MSYKALQMIAFDGKIYKPGDCLAISPALAAQFSEAALQKSGPTRAEVIAQALEAQSLSSEDFRKDGTPKAALRARLEEKTGFALTDTELAEITLPDPDGSATKTDAS